MAQKIKGKSAIVTGAGSGINLEFARVLLEGGANVLFADLALRPEAEDLVTKYGSGTPKAVFHRTDVTSWAALDSMFDAAEKHFGSVDIVCPGAGIFEPPFSKFWYPPGAPPSKDDPSGNSYKTLEINITHPVRTTQLAISRFLAASPPCSPSNPKTIVNIASIAGEFASLPHILYHTSKYAILGLIYSLADLEKLCGIRVAGVAPGIVKTPIFLDHPDKLRIVEHAREEDWVTPQEVATVMLALVEKNGIRPRRKNEDTEDIPIQGGTVLEVGPDFVRNVPMLNNPGPAPVVLEAVLKGDPENRAYQEVVDTLKPGFGKLTWSRT